MTRRIGWADLPGGQELPYVEHGDGDIALVLLHGYVESWRSFELLLPELPSSAKAFAVSLRGHGGPRTLADDYSLSATAGDVGSFMEAMGIRRGVLIGGSSGGYVAQRLALDRPDLVAGLVLAGSPRTLQGLPAAEALGRALAAQGDHVNVVLAREFVTDTLAQPVSPMFLETMIDQARSIPRRTWQAALQGLTDADPPTETGTIDAPTLILWGARDAFVSRDETERLGASIPASSLVVYRDAGHALLWEEPERAATDVARFLTTLERYAGAGDASA